MKQALVIGGSGLVGQALIRHLLESGDWVVRAFGRRPMGLEGVDSHVVDFEAVDSWADKLKGDYLFSSMGTTIKKAGSPGAFRRVDYTYQFDVAKAAVGNGVAGMVLVSSLGADAGSRLLYPRTKGELENALKALGFNSLDILRPSFLDGDRSESRPAERAGIAVMNLLGGLPWVGRYRPVSVDRLAAAMVRAAGRAEAGVRIVESDRIP